MVVEQVSTQNSMASPYIHQKLRQIILQIGKNFLNLPTDNQPDPKKSSSGWMTLGGNLNIRKEWSTQEIICIEHYFSIITLKNRYDCTTSIMELDCM